MVLSARPHDDEGPAQRRPFAFGLPVLATLVVLAAAAAMVGLGFWQLARAAEKEAVLAAVARNVGAPRIYVTPALDLAGNLLRPVSVDCGGGSPTRIAGAGRFGFRVIADCRVAGRTQPLAIQLGTGRSPRAGDPWPGGRVTGYVAQAPDNRSLLRQLFDRTPAAMMVVADPPVAGLSANPAPDLSAIPNNHRSYAVQWFSFAGIALVIFAIAARRRRRGT